MSLLTKYNKLLAISASVHGESSLKKKEKKYTFFKKIMNEFGFLGV